MTNKRAQEQSSGRSTPDFTQVNPAAQWLVNKMRRLLLGWGRVSYELSSPKIEQSHFMDQGLKSVEVNGTRLSYLEAGNPKSENKYCLIAGWPISAPSWALLMQEMTPPDADIHLVAITLPGLGSSDPIVNRRGDMDINRDSLITTLKSAIGVIFNQNQDNQSDRDVPINIIGHSTGALLAMVLLEKYPDKIKDITVMAPPWSQENRDQILNHHLPRTALYKFLRSQQWVLALARKNTIHNLVSGFMLDVYKQKYGYLTTDHQEFLSKLVADMEKMHMQAALQLASVVLEGGDWIDIGKIKEVLAQGGHQIKLVFGQHDRAVDPTTTRALYQQLTNQNTGDPNNFGITSVVLVEVRGAGHDMVFSHTAQLADIVLS